MTGSRVIRASAVPSRSVRWGWDGRDPIGYLAVQTGVEGLGKGVFAAWRIKGYTRGELPGEWRGQPVTALVIAGEDGIADTWRPRLELAGADLDRVAFLKLDAVAIDWNIRDGIAELHGAVEETGARVVFLDAVLDHLPSPERGESTSSPTWVRRALAPLKYLVRDLDLVAGYSMHPPKALSGDFRDLVQLSQAFSAVPRVGLLYAYHPDDQADDPDRRRVLIRGKGNLGRDPGAIEFRIAARPYRHDDGRTTDREVVVDVAPSTVTMADLAPNRIVGVAREPTKADRAADLIEAALANGDWHLAEPILVALARADLDSSSVVTSAKRRIGVEDRKRPGKKNGPWEWRLGAFPASRAESLPVTAPSHFSPQNTSNGGKAPRRHDLEPPEPKMPRRQPPEALRARVQAIAALPTEAEQDAAWQALTDNQETAA